MIGKVVGSYNDGLVWVEITCDENDMKHCGACGAHGTSGLIKPKRALATNSIGAVPGQEVLIELKTGAKTKAGLFLFIVPLLIFLIIAKIGTSMGISNPLIFLISFASIGMTFTGLRFILKNITYYSITKVKGTHG